MQKSRALPFDLGKTNGLFYASTSSYKSTNAELHAWWLDHPARYSEGVASANNSVTYTALGTQKFCSTVRPRPTFNACENIKHQGVCYPLTYTRRDYRAYRATTYFAAKLYAFAVPGTAYMASATPVKGDWNEADGAARRAWWAMQPRFEGEFQALNFIYELKDFKDIAKHMSRINLKDVRANLVGVKKKITQAKKRLQSGSAIEHSKAILDASTKVAAEAVLTKRFAIDPTVRDCITLHGQLVSLLDKVQKEFFDRGKDTQSSHYSEVLSETDTLTPGSTNSYWISFGERLVTRFTATMQYRYEYKMRDWFQALKRYYGLNLNASVVWNALPFTFVVDYFLKVGQAIDFMSTDPNVELRLMQYCESLLTQHSHGSHITGDDRASIYVNGAPSYAGQLFSGYMGSWYHRKVTHPNKGAALPRLTLPSSKQCQNLVALVRAMW